MLAVVAAALGRMDDAFLLFERACDELLQTDPRMERIYRFVGFPG